MRAAAIFDLDRTLLAPPSSERAFFRYLLAKRRVPLRTFPYAAAGALALARRGPIAATKGNKFIWRGWKRSELEREALACFDEVLRSRVYAKAWQVVEEHKSKGDLVVLLSGTLDVLLAPFVDALRADLWFPSRLETTDGRITGALEGNHPFGAGKRRIVHRLFRENELDPERSFAYGDDLSDVAVLSAVGHPVATNPSPALAPVARRMGWRIERFQPPGYAFTDAGTHL